MTKYRLATAIVAGALGVAASALPAFALTVGSKDSGNCYPFNCNDSGSNVGQSFDYQEMYLGTAVGTITINQISFQAWPFGNTPALLGGSYDITLGTTFSPLGSVGLVPLNNVATFDNVTISSAHGISNYLTFNGAAYAFNPLTDGNLVMEVVVNNQDNGPNGSGNGYLWADYTGTDVLRAYMIGSGGVTGQTTGALVTTFNGVPEPSTWAMMLLGFAGLAFAGHRASRKSAAALAA